MALEDMEIISGVFTGSEISKGFGKIVAVGALKIPCLDSSDFRS
jgi:hypothetical protein